MAEPILDVEVATYLKSVGFGDLFSDRGSRTKTLFVGEEPSEVSRAGHSITVLEEPGGPGQVTGHVEERSFQVRIRHPDYLEGKALAQRINRALNQQQGILSNIQVARIVAVSNPVHLGQNADRMQVFTQSFTVLMKRIIPTDGVDFNPDP